MYEKKKLCLKGDMLVKSDYLQGPVKRQWFNSY